MLPPNVITGIPLVRLGSSAIEANKALTSVKGNKLKAQSISGWTVYVLHKANSTEPAMQVYVRHGLVEALRIFDNAFIAPDFGVQLNDDFSTVKAKFGEPTFIRDEADCPSAKNYVYPISQVSFELARPEHFAKSKSCERPDIYCQIESKILDQVSSIFFLLDLNCKPADVCRVQTSGQLAPSGKL